MNSDPQITRSNVERYRRLLADPAMDDDRRLTIAKLLAEAEEALARHANAGQSSQVGHR